MHRATACSYYRRANRVKTCPAAEQRPSLPLRLHSRRRGRISRRRYRATRSWLHSRLRHLPARTGRASPRSSKGQMDRPNDRHSLSSRLQLAGGRVSRQQAG
ncbi:unnamed protein product [Oikopleura dioica]|uniref:Uncharacterized protein n=1 Tax=Oikopleura dioica TaxID=34765 RepID=E4Y912_OIKDI|nr:unnamed protein product [Oikopleura dioica]